MLWKRYLVSQQKMVPLLLYVGRVKKNYNFIISCWDNKVVICRTLITQKVKIVGLSFIVHPSDFKSDESFFKKYSPDQKSGFRFAERNAKSFLRFKIRFWIHRKEHTLMFELLSWTTAYSDLWLNLTLICRLSTNAPFTSIKHVWRQTRTTGTQVFWQGSNEIQHVL